MIRFSCRKCGKSLRADETIIGRSSRCTSCRAINRVPSQSTRKSGEKPERILQGSALPVRDENDDPFGEEVVTLIAESESDSFEAFENFDFSGLQIQTLPVGANPRAEKAGSKEVAESPISPKTLASTKVAEPRSIPSATRWAEQKVPPSSPVDSWRPQSNLPLMPLIAIGAISLLMVVAYAGYLYISSGPRVVEKTQLQLSAVGNGHTTILFQFKKAGRVMANMELAYRQKKLPEAGLSAVTEIQQRAKELLESDIKKMEEANRLYEAGDKQGAYAILNAQIESMQALQKEIESQTKWLERKVFP